MEVTISGYFNTDGVTPLVHGTNSRYRSELRPCDQVNLNGTVAEVRCIVSDELFIASVTPPIISGGTVKVTAVNMNYVLPVAVPQTNQNSFAVTQGFRSSVSPWYNGVLNDSAPLYSGDIGLYSAVSQGPKLPDEYRFFAPREYLVLLQGKANSRLLTVPAYGAQISTILGSKRAVVLRQPYSLIPDMIVSIQGYPYKIIAQYAAYNSSGISTHYVEFDMPMSKTLYTVNVDFPEDMKSALVIGDYVCVNGQLTQVMSVTDGGIVTDFVLPVDGLYAVYKPLMLHWYGINSVVPFNITLSSNWFVPGNTVLTGLHKTRADGIARSISDSLFLTVESQKTDYYSTGVLGVPNFGLIKLPFHSSWSASTLRSAEGNLQQYMSTGNYIAVDGSVYRVTGTSVYGVSFDRDLPDESPDILLINPGISRPGLTAGLMRMGLSLVNDYLRYGHSLRATVEMLTDRYQKTWYGACELRSVVTRVFGVYEPDTYCINRYASPPTNYEDNSIAYRRVSSTVSESACGILKRTSVPMQTVGG
jgi:hypothetical protein